jgi:hypothetical protein
MKKLTTTIALLLTLFVTNANAQAKKVDSVATDVTPVLSIQDLARVDSLLQRKFTVAQQRDYQEILAFMQTIVTNRVNQYNASNKSAAKKP